VGVFAEVSECFGTVLSSHPIDREPVIASPASPNEKNDGRATDRYFASTIGSHQCGVLMDVMG